MTSLAVQTSSSTLSVALHGWTTCAPSRGGKVDGVIIRVETGWVEVATRVWEGLAVVDVYTDRVASSGILVWHWELGKQLWL